MRYSYWGDKGRKGRRDNIFTCKHTCTYLRPPFLISDMAALGNLNTAGVIGMTTSGWDWDLDSEGFYTVRNYQMLSGGVWKSVPRMYRSLNSVCVCVCLCLCVGGRAGVGVGRGSGA